MDGSTTNSGTTVRAELHAAESAGWSCRRRSRVNSTTAVSVLSRPGRTLAAAGVMTLF